MTELHRKDTRTVAPENIHDRIDRLQREWNRPEFMRPQDIEGEPISVGTALLAHRIADALTQRFHRVWVGPMNEGELTFEWRNATGGECIVIVHYLEPTDARA